MNIITSGNGEYTMTTYERRHISFRALAQATRFARP